MLIKLFLWLVWHRSKLAALTGKHAVVAFRFLVFGKVVARIAAWIEFVCVGWLELVGFGGLGLFGCGFSPLLRFAHGSLKECLSCH